MSDPYWLIEQIIDGNAHWWMREPNQYTYWGDKPRWTRDSSKARRYKTKADAEFVIGDDMVGCTATEHLDIGEQHE